MSKARIHLTVQLFPFKENRNRWVEETQRKLARHANAYVNVLTPHHLEKAGITARKKTQDTCATDDTCLSSFPLIVFRLEEPKDAAIFAKESNL